MVQKVNRFLLISNPYLWGNFSPFLDNQSTIFQYIQRMYSKIPSSFPFPSLCLPFISFLTNNSLYCCLVHTFLQIPCCSPFFLYYLFLLSPFFTISEPPPPSLQTPRSHLGQVSLFSPLSLEYRILAGLEILGSSNLSISAS